jgi:hypothetical protein
MNNGRDYEELALMILGERRKYFGLERVEGENRSYRR